MEKLPPDMQEPSPHVRRMVEREIIQLRDLVMAEIKATRVEIVTRIDGMDKALDKVNEFPTEMDSALLRLREFFETRFASVDMLLGERDKRFDQLTQSNREMLKEQRSSSELAISKAESSTATLLRIQEKGLEDIKGRLDKSEGADAGGLKLWGIMVGAIVVTGVIVSIISAIAVAWLRI